MASELHVLIVGAGIGGLMLGLLLEKANISYEIFEQASELKPLGSAVTVGSVMHIFEQLGMYKEMLEISKPFGALRLRDTKLDFKGSFQDYGSGRDYEDLYGDYTRIVARPDLVNLLLKRIPSGRIHYSKRVQKTTQDESEAVVHCHDDTKYSGTIVVGADGAYSGIRQEMYKELDAKSALPRDDAKPTVHGYDCVVGMTKALNPKVHPILEDMFSEFEVVLNKEISLTCWFMPLTGNRMGWMIIRDVRNEEDDSERNAESPEWGPDTALDITSAHGIKEGPFFSVMPATRCYPLEEWAPLRL
ncbi:hypothetical protein BGZ51_006375 [Haplosporangium sp. Z 767]|nr:hypothetical protein BGZ50_001113 [Haplosporangium sp. Z 11]KAF9192017.1 hypothetical protein BGZ51_006375 [Haplosporangium sp. Z 767]